MYREQVYGFDETAIALTNSFSPAGMHVLMKWPLDKRSEIVRSSAFFENTIFSS